MDNIIEAAHLTRVYGNNSVLDNISFQIPRGEIYGVLGRNGAGKTTLIKVLLNIIDKSAGEIRYSFAEETVPYGSRNLYKHVAAVLESVDNLYDYLTGLENLRYFVELGGGLWRQKKEQAEELLVLFELDEDADKRVGEYSRGMQQKLAIISGLLSNAEILFLDEPTLGLDFVASHQLIKQIKKINESMNKTIILTSHQADVVEDLIDRLLLLDDHKILYQGKFTAFKKLYSSASFIIEAISPADREIKTYQYSSKKAQQAALQDFVSKGFSIVTVSRRNTTLDEILQGIFLNKEVKL